MRLYRHRALYQFQTEGGTTITTETTLIRELQTGSTDAMEDAVARYTPYLTAVVKRQLGDRTSPEDVEEIIADVFLTLWANRKRLVAGNLKSWLATVARIAALGRLRKKHHPQVPLEETIPATDESAEELLDARERDRILRNALKSLSETDQEIIHRFYLDAIQQPVPDVLLPYHYSLPAL